MSDALDQALHALRHRDRSTAEVDRYLESRGVGEDERRTALETLTRTDLVDDRRYAERRALSLANRGAGNALIRHELARAGLDHDVVDHALDSLSPERERAEEIVARRGASPKTARYLTGKGFSYDVVESFIAQSRRETLG
jgi:SOS response regulatory protein OraA/RecX